jgi:hypothetical protein
LYNSSQELRNAVNFCATPGCFSAAQKIFVQLLAGVALRSEFLRYSRLFFRCAINFCATPAAGVLIVGEWSPARPVL